MQPTDDPGPALRRELGLLTEEEVAALADVEVRTIQSWRSDGRGPAYVRLGKAAFYRKDSVIKWIMASEVRAGQ